MSDEAQLERPSYRGKSSLVLPALNSKGYELFCLHDFQIKHVKNGNFSVALHKQGKYGGFY